MNIFKGSGVAIVTPFCENGVNFEKLEELIEWHIENNTDAIIICGTTGESSTMTETERKETIKFTVEKVHGRIPVIAGTGSNNTSATIELSKWAKSIGVDGLLLITPYYNKTTQKGIIEHFKAINDNVNIPMILYNVPGRTGLNLLPETLVKICELCSNIVAIKEASGDLSQIIKIKALLKDRIDIYSGNDDQIIPILSVGGIGVISVLANIMPKEVHNMCKFYLNGQIKKALEIQLDTLSLTNSLFIETNPIPIKTAMNLMGIDVGELRLPLCNMDENNLKLLKKELLNHNLIK
ncbi:4-hydroxy-tetrahydrodipicolinate synthase [Clostridium cochlearium]|jgi:4-hydroxy-tetrahydrodipicolinate synthase|uniref:4-hydroxy-tetrahydrodipicolinate synthase n=1 Tax=Clostridium cochlearium TaxID=1494 RepID=A0A240ATE0_CLOCO|nr:4-hydroxy-tetrahydrodipicolinate synthase [Clostridium cochlearium]MBV1819435.1 4-hydroxy-tetrahydrodipicolinate synthase [Bacteroidales bacterium MSK.15.36]NSJ91505.1 4-hydroxy-tetrahydrodipicolinate synthase [Coprococcus sp. MSK.21.13]MBE6064788.1 4-hydroxy-tetrahydrodipicolinate synthase [Clostridium cochlearium]MBU5268266.1 4-hydroxy-tetrahydrodipicolinate synthase [Clostridium cochlearium]MCG4571824.1 4-hydroxy-tetrahydrodipicolinate synthase [Clostridium cochlearium]